jgi:hypothetical protein
LILLHVLIHLSRQYSHFNFIIVFAENVPAPVGVVVEHEHAASSTPIETRVAADGVAYSWAEFENYFDAETAGATKHAISKNDHHSSSNRRSQTMFSYLPKFDLG